MQNDLISRSAPIDRYYAEYEKQDICDGDEDRDWLKKCIEEAPAVDAVEVVRCKDCKWLYDGKDMYCCIKHTGLALINRDGLSFCSYGERRTDDG